MNTRQLIRSLFLIACLSAVQVGVAQAPAGAPAGATGLCKDGTYYTGANKQGACHGHQGVKDWYGAPANSGKAASASGSTEAAAPSHASSAPGPAPAGATGLCNDGTYYTGANKQGACRGHQGVKDWYGAPATSAKAGTTATPEPAPAPSAGHATAAPVPVQSSPAAAPKTSATPTAPAPGASPDKVWLNTASNVYHCPGTKYYGTTKAGAYMTEAEAKAKGARPDHGKSCQ